MFEWIAIHLDPSISAVVIAAVLLGTLVFGWRIGRASGVSANSRMPRVLALGSAVGLAVGLLTGMSLIGAVVTGTDRRDVLLSLPVVVPLLALPAISRGLISRRAWARPAAMVFWAGLATGMVLLAVLEPALGRAGLLAAAGQAVVCLLLAWWYLYRRRSVQVWFASGGRSAA